MFSAEEIPEPKIHHEKPDETNLPPQSGRDKGRKTLVVDLDETLVHSSFQPIDNEDILLKVLLIIIKLRLRFKEKKGNCIF